ncbi:cAMP receptor protein [bacterium BMS3Bbin06]|nr:cAMP receptor protein [bacterium BMS3Abin08]GBE35035.1 cAMP receptor protein [bacterium BMS3Bbin06]HDO36031.1 Crp/Fnr family transcriptional regulator [Nitrospirota bacterium]HDY71308.1 Crp/Fnr family transcriptional regulator [Nitrospirota bacterium]
MIENLKKTEIFKDLQDEELNEIAPYIREKSFMKREMIFSEGDPPDFLYIVKDGKVKVTKLSHEGKEIILEIISPYDFFGGIAVIKGFPYPANAVPMDDTTVWMISRNNLLLIIDRFPSLMYSLTMSLGDRMRVSHETLKNIALERVESRIASLLLKLSDKMGKQADEGLLIDMKLTKQDIADMVGTTVETAIRTMSKLKKSGYISEKGGRILILDREGLASLGS